MDSPAQSNFGNKCLRFDFFHYSIMVRIFCIFSKLTLIRHMSSSRVSQLLNFYFESWTYS